MKSKGLRVSLCAVLAFLDIVPLAIIFTRLRNENRLIPVNQASEHLMGIVAQNVIPMLLLIVYIMGALLYYKKDFTKAMALSVQTKKQKVIVCLLGAVLLGMFVALLMIKKDPVMVTFSLIYYLVIVAFNEEFLIRGIGANLVGDFPTVFRYLIPNVLFAAMHIFSYKGFGALSLEYVISFIASDFFGLTIIGCLFQLVKEKTGTLWAPVLLHAILDYSVVFRF